MIGIEDDAAALQAFLNSPITLGTDMEVTLHLPNNPFMAVDGLQYWTTVKDGRLGTDGRTSFFRYLVELRPDYSKVPDQLVTNTQALINEAIEDYPGLDKLIWKAGTGELSQYSSEGDLCNSYLPKGGHIHFGHDSGKYQHISFESNPEIVYLLDMLLAPLILLLEDPMRAILRRGLYHDFQGGTLYGQLGSAKGPTKYNTWEYRTLPNFMKNRQLSVSVFAISKAIAHEVLVNKGKVSALLYKYRSVVRQHPILFAFCIKDFFRPQIKTIIKILKTLSLLQNDYGQELLNYIESYVNSNLMWPIGSNMITDFNISSKETIEKGELDKVTKQVLAVPYDCTADPNHVLSVVRNSDGRAYVDNASLVDFTHAQFHPEILILSKRTSKYFMSKRDIKIPPSLAGFARGKLCSSRNFLSSVIAGPNFAGDKSVRNMKNHIARLIEGLQHPPILNTIII